MNALTTPARTLEDWLTALVAAASSAPETLREVAIHAMESGVAGIARERVTCGRCDPLEVFLFTAVPRHLVAAPHEPGDLRPAPPPSPGPPVSRLPWRVEQCKDCHARVIWATHIHTASRMPFDAAPSSTGTWCLEDKGGLDAPLARVLIHAERDRAEADEQGIAVYTCHFATCPKRNKTQSKGRRT